MTTVAARPDLPARAWQGIDWRFLLPVIAGRSVACSGLPADQVAALRLVAGAVTVVSAGHRPERPVDLIAARDPRPRDLPGLLEHLAPRGLLYLEVRPRRLAAVGPRSLPGWRRRVAAAGLTDARLHWHAPGLDVRSRIVPLASVAAVRAALASHEEKRFGAVQAAIARALLRVGLLPYVIPAGSLLAARSGCLPHGAVDDALLEIRPQLRAEDVVLVTPSYPTSRHVVALVHGRVPAEPSLVVKIARSQADSASVRREAQTLRVALGGRADVPKLLGCVDVSGNSALVETSVGLTLLSPRRVRRDPDRAAQAGCDFAASLPETGTWAACDIDTRALRMLLELLPPREQRQLAARTAAVILRLSDARLPAVMEHGDLSHPNLLLGPEGKLRVVDWERFAERGLPGQDLAYFLAYVAEARVDARSVPARLRACEAALWSADGWARPLLERHLAARGVDRSLVRPLLLAYWARASSTLVPRLCGAGVSPAEFRDVALADRDFLLWRHCPSEQVVAS